MYQIKDNILTNKFVRLIEENHQMLVEHFMNDVLKNEYTTSYKSLDPQKLYEIGSRVYRELSRWVQKSLPKKEIDNYYRKLGKERLFQGIPYTQFFQALVLLKRQIWLFMINRIEEDIFEYKQALELTGRVIWFFDRAALYMLIGYKEEDNKPF